MRKFLAMSLVAAMVLMSGCGKANTAATTGQPTDKAEQTEQAKTEQAKTEGTEAGASEASEEVKESLVVGFCPPTMNNPFYYWIEQNVREEVEGRGDTLITMDPQLDHQKQIEQVEDGAGNHHEY